MTDTIDLDEMEVEDDEEEPDGNYGDWVWRGEGDPDDEPDAEFQGPPPGPGMDESETETDSMPTEVNVPTAETEEPGNRAAPGVPRRSDGPAGVPEERGGAGSGPGSTQPQADDVEHAGTAESHNATTPSDMTMAMTYKAAHYFEDPQVVFGEAEAWADWLGIVGEVSTPVIRKFQRDHLIDLDFFGGSESGPSARLAEVDEESMFFAERMVLVGVEDDDEWIAEEAGWEFVPLTEAAEKADWELKEDLVD